MLAHKLSRAAAVLRSAASMTVVAALCAGPLAGPAQAASGYSAYGVGVWPTVLFRPYSDGSPFNRPAAGSAVHASSTRIVQHVMSWGLPGNLFAGTAGTASDFGHPTYWAQPTDPLLRARLDRIQPRRQRAQDPHPGRRQARGRRRRPHDGRRARRLGVRLLAGHVQAARRRDDDVHARRAHADRPAGASRATRRPRASATSPASSAGRSWPPATSTTRSSSS